MAALLPPPPVGNDPKDPAFRDWFYKLQQFIQNGLAPLTSLGTGLVTKIGTNLFAARTLTGTTNRITVTNGDGVSGNPTIDISGSYVGQNSITTLGTITSGTWNGTVITYPFGGTGLSTLGTPNQVLAVNAGATAIEWQTQSGGDQNVDGGDASSIYTPEQVINGGNA